MIDYFGGSIGVTRTRVLFKAPQILQACKGKCVSWKPELFMKAVDDCSYKIVIGKLLFEGHPQNNYDLVLNGHYLR
jgi:hypothetical protein